MTDLDLLLAGCVVSFIALLGAYTFVRQGYNAEKESRIVQRRPEDAKSPKRRAA